MSTSAGLPIGEPASADANSLNSGSSELRAMVSTLHSSSGFSFCGKACPTSAISTGFAVVTRVCSSAEQKDPSAAVNVPSIAQLASCKLAAANLEKR